MADISVYLYQMNTDANVVGKLTYGEGAVAEVQGTFRGEVNVITPILEIARQKNTSLDVNKFNYVYIPSLSRYYFVQNITISPDGIMLLSLNEDVLETYKDSIREMEAFVERSQNNYDDTIPDDRVVLHPEINYTNISCLRHGTGETTLWRTCEDIWDDPIDENTKLTYLIRFNFGDFYHKWGSSGSSTQRQEYPNTPQPILICTKKFLEQFLKKLNGFVEGVIDHWSSFKDAIQSIETIPDGVYWNDSHYPSLRAGTATLVDSKLINLIKLGPKHFEFNDEVAGQSPAWAFLLSPDHMVKETYWKWSANISTNWKNSQNFTSYSCKFNPFGVFELPSDSFLGETDIFFKVRHSLVTGQAQFSVYSQNVPEIILAEKVLNFKLPFAKGWDYGTEVQRAAFAALTIFSAYAGFANMAASAASASKVAEAGKSVASITSAKGGAAKNIAFPGNNAEVFATQTAISAASSSKTGTYLAESMAFAKAGLNSIPSEKYDSQLNGVLMDTVVYVRKATRQIIQSPIKSSGRPCMKTLKLGLYGGFMKIGSFNFQNFRTSSTEPSPLASEYELILDQLTSGIYMIRDLSNEEIVDSVE